MKAKEPVNRVANDLDQWRTKEERFEQIFSSSVLRDKHFLREKLKYYYTIQAKYAVTANVEEKLALRILEQERSRIEKQLYPNVLFRLLLKVLLALKQPHTAQQSMQQTAINEQALKGALTKAGFSHINNQLEQQMKQGHQQFYIPVSYYATEKERLDFNLSFAKDYRNQYRLEGYTASLSSDGKLQENRQQHFSIEQGNAITATQAYNLLAGRAIQKEYIDEGRRQNVWMQLDFNDKDALGNYRIKEFHAAYGYDLKRVVQQLPLKELMTVEGAEKLMNAMTNGYQQEVTLQKDGSEQKLFIEANPQFKSVNIYDEGSKKISLASALGNETVEQAQQMGKKFNLQQDIGKMKRNGLSIS